MSYQQRVERVLNASAEEVFEAYTDAEAQKVWFRLGLDPDGDSLDTMIEVTFEDLAGKTRMVRAERLPDRGGPTMLL